MSTYIPVKGTKDLINDDYHAQQHIIDIAKKVAHLYGFEPISTPIIEHTNIYKRTLGDSSDIVSKEMYSFTDKGGDEITLRPEFTAGIVRAFVSNGLQHKTPLKLFSHGPLFRHERPQAGRQRQFHQLNFEHLGANNPYSDAEMICCAADILTNLDLINDVQLEINSLGCQNSRLNYRQSLVNYFSNYFTELSDDSKNRLNNNPLRILDSKDENDIILIKNAPRISVSYTIEAANYFEKVLNYLDQLKVKYIVNERLVRGLDYYSHTAFEFTTTKIGAQSAVIAGGRYDSLVKMMRGGEVKAIGFASGIERLCLMKNFAKIPDISMRILPINENTELASIALAQKLRSINIPCIVETEGKFIKRLKKCNDKNVQQVVIIGEEELKDSKFILKNLNTGQEDKVDIDQLISNLNYNKF